MNKIVNFSFFFLSIENLFFFISATIFCFLLLSFCTLLPNIRVKAIQHENQRHCTCSSHHNNSGSNNHNINLDKQETLKIWEYHKSRKNGKDEAITAEQQTKEMI